MLDFREPLAVLPDEKSRPFPHRIAPRGLKDDGRAVLILGEINKLATTPEAKSDAYNGKAKREFFKTLYDRYNVVDHFTVSGDLYERQGAGWPVDVIVIAGRGKSRRASPAVDIPRQLDTWNEVEGDADIIRGSSTRPPDLSANGPLPGGPEGGGSPRRAPSPSRTSRDGCGSQSGDPASHRQAAGKCRACAPPVAATAGHHPTTGCRHQNPL